MSEPELSIDPEFAAICWKLLPEELAFLADTMRREGCLDPIRYWTDPKTGKNLVVDGHNRLKLCEELKIEYTTEAMEFADRNAVLDWIARNQLGRRNASEIQKANIRGYLYKKRVEEKQEPHGNLAKEVAQETGVTEDKIHKDAAFHRSMEALGKKSEKLREAALHGHITKKDALVLADAAPEVVQAIERAPEVQWRGAAKQAAESIRNHKPRPQSGRPIVDVRALNDMDTHMGRLVRAKTDAYKACGAWAKQYEEDLRATLTKATEIILAWQKEAQRRSERRAA